MSATESSQGRSKALNIVVWIVSVLVCVSLMMPGVSKVVNLEGRSLDGWSQRFEKWGCRNDGFGVRSRPTASWPGLLIAEAVEKVGG